MPCCLGMFHMVTNHMGQVFSQRRAKIQNLPPSTNNFFGQSKKTGLLLGKKVLT